MKARIARWGNSLGVRIPRDVAGRAGLAAGTEVEIEAKGNGVVIAPTRPHYRLEDLLVGMTTKAMHRAFEWGPDRGRETVD